LRSNFILSHLLRLGWQRIDFKIGIAVPIAGVEDVLHSPQIRRLVFTTAMGNGIVKENGVTHVQQWNARKFFGAQVVVGFKFVQCGKVCFWPHQRFVSHVW
jgi:hypothetical protein